MKKVIFFLAFFSLLFALHPCTIKADKPMQVQMTQNEEEYIYVKVIVNGTTYVFVYLSDGITLVNVYEEED